MKTWRIGYLLNSPVHYRVPLCHRLAHEPSIQLEVLFFDDSVLGAYFNPECREVVDYGTPQLKGLNYRFLRSTKLASAGVRPPWWPLTLWRCLKRGSYDVLWIHAYTRPYGLVTMIVARLLGIRVFLRDTPTRLSAPLPPLRGIKILVKKVLYRILNLLCDAVLYVGTRNREHARWYGIPERKLFPVPNTVDNARLQSLCREAAPDRDSLRKEHGLVPGRPVILFVGKLIDRKRPFDLLDAYGQLSPDDVTEPDAHILFLGTGQLLDALTARVLERGWNNLRFCGVIPQSQLPRYLDLGDIVVLPSAVESFGLVVNEAMNAGKPVIVSDHVGCAPDLVENGSNGYVFPLGDTAALAAGLRALLRDPALRAQMGRNSLERINRWNHESCVRGLRLALQSLDPATVDPPAGTY